MYRHYHHHDHDHHDHDHQHHHYHQQHHHHHHQTTINIINNQHYLDNLCGFEIAFQDAYDSGLF